MDPKPYGGGRVDAGAGPTDLAALLNAQQQSRPVAEFRSGQWVTFIGNIKGAQTTPGGRIVGIYHPAHVRRAVVVHAGPDGKPLPNQDEFVPALVYVVKPNGSNLMYIKEDDTLGQVAFSPSILVGLEPLIEADHIPESRRKHLSPGHKFAP